ncbi:hypothetical protein MBANPS3_006930 [Mucor bainieri]
MVQPTLESLPVELWMNVFAQFTGRKELAQCRMVCKTWDPLAEKAMFSQAFSFPRYQKTAVQLYYHLARKPFLGRYIKSIKIVNNYMIRQGAIEFSDPLMSTTNKVEIRYALMLTFDDKEGAKVDISRTNSTQHTNFVLSVTPDSSNAFAQQLLSFSTGTSDFTELDINLHLYKDTIDESEHVMTFYKILKMIPHARILRFCDKKIEYGTTYLDTLALNDLEHLQFYATVIGFSS